MGQRKILVADDDEGVRQFLKDTLTLDDFDVLTARDGDEALRMIGEVALDLAILDIMMPGKDGLEVLRRLRKTSAIPVIMLSGKVDESDKVGAFELGADDYVTKPITGPELAARVRAVLRRAAGSAVMQESGFHDGHLRIGPKGRHVLVDGTEVILTRTQYRLLLYLASHRGEVLSYDQIIEEVWGTEYQGERERVHDCVRSLRKKIDPDPNRPGHIVSIPGEGYRFDPHN